MRHRYVGNGIERSSAALGSRVDNDVPLPGYRRGRAPSRPGDAPRGGAGAPPRRLPLSGLRLPDGPGPGDGLPTSTAMTVWIVFVLALMFVGAAARGPAGPPGPDGDGITAAGVRR